MNRKHAIKLMCLGAVAPLCGCKTITPDVAARINLAAKAAVFIGARLYMKQHPETRLAFTQARDSLKVLEVAETIDMVTVLAVLNSLPIKSFSDDSSEVLLLVTVANLFLADALGTLPVEKLGNLRPLVKALREGLDLALV